MDNPSRVFAAVLPASDGELAGNEKEQGPDGRTVNRPSPGNRVRELQVTGSSEVCCPADRVCVRVSVGNSKEAVNEVTNSVSRRLEYILQSLRWNPAAATIRAEELHSDLSLTLASCYMELLLWYTM